MAGSVSHTTVAEALSGKRVPSWTALEAIVSALDGDVERFRDLWLDSVATPTGAVAFEQYREQVKLLHGLLRAAQFEGPYTAVPFDDIYVPPQISARTPHGASVVNLDVDALVSTQHHAVILGEPGSGKTSLCTALMLYYARRTNDLLPIFIPVREFATAAERLSVSDLISQRLNAVYQCKVSEELVDGTLAAGHGLVLLDGLDELLHTSKRRQIAATIELFANQYPEAKIIVTARSIGYDEAPLDPTRFPVFTLNEFDQRQVEAYVSHWFEFLQSVEESSGKTPPYRLDAYHMTHEFLRESERLADLRSSPLMLSLLCAYYRGAGFIPRSRPELFERLALLLLDRWDRARGIPVSAPKILSPQRVLGEIAVLMTTHPDVRSGLPERRLIIALMDLFEREVGLSRRDEAGIQAREFVHFVRGRAGMFTDVGTTADGEPIYAFTHRSFLEYFAARETAAAAPHPERLAEIIAQHLGDDDAWQEIGLMALEIADSHYADGARRVAGTLQTIAIEAPEHQRHAIKQLLRTHSRGGPTGEPT